MSEAKCPFGYGNEDGADGAGSDYSHAAVAPALTREQLPRLAPAPIEVGRDGLPTGRCLCGKVSYQINKPVEKVFANHDENSRRWSGGIALTIMLQANSTEFHGWGNIVQNANTSREIHCFCRLCGSSMFVRYTQPETMSGMISLSAGTLDNFEGLKLTAETYIDCKPDMYSFEGERRVMTESEVEAMFVIRPAAE